MNENFANLELIPAVQNVPIFFVTNNLAQRLNVYGLVLLVIWFYICDKIVVFSVLNSDDLFILLKFWWALKRCDSAEFYKFQMIIKSISKDEDICVNLDFFEEELIDRVIEHTKWILPLPIGVFQLQMNHASGFGNIIL
jgi:hypothetical protein